MRAQYMVKKDLHKFALNNSAVVYNTCMNKCKEKLFTFFCCIVALHTVSRPALCCCSRTVLIYEITKKYSTYRTDTQNNKTG